MPTVIIALILIFLIAIALINEHRSRRTKSGSELVENQAMVTKPTEDDEEEELSPTSTARMRARAILSSANIKQSNAASGTSQKVFKSEPVFPEDLPPLPDPFEEKRK
ncbi:MAG: hypothetical protein IT292_09205 [Deltaproteobacteria bacterium]|nr:hypothetical protein [Deltaproteobacteria bacterium]